MTLHSPDLAAPAALARRYRQEVGAPGSWNATLESILRHRSVRAYRPDPPPAGTTDLALAAAQSAPSSSNLQAWSLVAVADPARRARIEALAGPNPQILEAPLLLVWVADLSRLRRSVTRQNRPGEALDFLESFVLAALDAALAAQTAVVALESLGLGTCYIGAIRNRPEAVAAELGLPPEAVAVFGLTVGYPDPARPAAVKPRLGPAAVLHREGYDAAAEAAAVAAYDESLRAFQTEQGQTPAGWSDPVAVRVGSAAALRGRDGLGAALRRLGFGLK
jgi:nitroreductase